MSRGFRPQELFDDARVGVRFTRSSLLRVLLVVYGNYSPGPFTLGYLVFLFVLSVETTRLQGSGP